MGTWWLEHPDLDGVARRGRRELTDDAAEGETDTEQLRKRRRSLVDLCFEWMSRGDHVTIGISGRQFEGRLVAAVNDLLLLQTNDVEVAVSIPSVSFVRSNRQAALDGTSGERRVSSFRAYLGAAEIDRFPVRLVGEGFDVTGIVDASTDDHWLVIDDQGVKWALTRSSVHYCTASNPD